MLKTGNGTFRNSTYINTAFSTFKGFNTAISAFLGACSRVFNYGNGALIAIAIYTLALVRFKTGIGTPKD